LPPTFAEPLAPSAATGPLPPTAPSGVPREGELPDVAASSPPPVSAPDDAPGEVPASPAVEVLPESEEGEGEPTPLDQGLVPPFGPHAANTTQPESAARAIPHRHTRVVACMGSPPWPLCATGGGGSRTTARGRGLRAVRLEFGKFAAQCGNHSLSRARARRLRLGPPFPRKNAPVLARGWPFRP
jgi:hypothetical protein